MAACIDQFVAEDFIAPGKLRRIDRVGRLAIAACKLALDDAGLLGGIDAWRARHRRRARHFDFGTAHR